MPAQFQGLIFLIKNLPNCTIKHPQIIMGNLRIICPVLASGIYTVIINNKNVRIKGCENLLSFISSKEIFAA